MIKTGKGKREKGKQIRDGYRYLDIITTCFPDNRDHFNEDDALHLKTGDVEATLGSLLR